MFSEASVSHSVHMGGVCVQRESVFRWGLCSDGSVSRGVCVQGGGSLSEGSLSRRESLFKEALCTGGSLWREPPVLTPTASQYCSGHTHPTGMHPCHIIYLSVQDIWPNKNAFQ